MVDFEIRDEIILHNELGRGSYGRVCVGDWKGTPVAVKMINGDGQLVADVFTRFLQNFVEEWKTLKSLRHPNVLQFYGVCSPDSDHPKMVMELMHQSLDHRLRDGAPLTHVARLYVLRSIVCGLRYMHELPDPVVHRDLSSKNILLSRDASHVKIADLGVAKALEDLQSMTGTVTPGTELYTPPEVRCGGATRPSLDIFSFGVIAIETLTGRSPSPLPLLVAVRGHPGQFRTLPEVERRREDLDHVPRAHPLRAVICQCLDEATRRPTASQVLKTFNLPGKYDLKHARPSTEDAYILVREYGGIMGVDVTALQNRRQSKVFEVDTTRKMEQLELEVERERDASAAAVMRVSLQGTLRNLSYRSQMAGICKPVVFLQKENKQEFNVWKSVPGLPAPQKAPPMTIFNDQLVVAESQSESLHFIDLKTWGVTKTAKYWNTHMNFQALITHCDHLFAVMWNKLTWRYRVEEYSTDQNTWSPIADMPDELEVSNATIASTHDKLFILGGTTRNNDAINNSWVYDFDEGQWDVLPSMPTRRSAVSCVVTDEQLCVGGGVLPDGTACNDFCVMSLESRQWHTFSSTTNYACSLGTIQGLPIAAGGRSDKRKKKTVSSHVELYDYHVGAWLPIPPLPTARWQPSLCTSDVDVMIVAGGASKKGDQSAIEILDCRVLRT